MIPAIPKALGEVMVRHLQAGDYAAYIALERDSAVKKFVSGPTSKSDAELLGDLSRYEPTTEVMAIAQTTSNAFIGRCGLLPTNNVFEVEIYCLLAQAHWRKGICGIVVPFLANLVSTQGKVAVGIVDPQNQGSLALLKKLGWIFVGTVRDSGKQHGHMRFVEPQLFGYDPTQTQTLLNVSD
jgi:RimJ/RimL family protein N-acetyltransferase